MKTSFLSLVLPVALATAPAHAAVTLVSHYGLGEAGTVGGASPFTPLIDDVGAADNFNFSNVPSANASIGTTGAAAPGSSAYLVKTDNNVWIAQTATTSFSNNWALQIWMRPATAGGTIQFQTNDSVDGISIWFQNGSDGDGSDIAFGRGFGGTGGSPNGNLFDYSADTWYRIGIVRHNDTNYYYVNGTQVGSDTGTGVVGTMRIGNAVGGLNGGAGAYDEINIWSFDHTTDSLVSVETAMNLVPEPSAAFLGALGLLPLLRRKRA